MREKLPSIVGGIFGAFLGDQVWTTIISAAGTILLAFVGGMAGYLGKLAVDRIIKKIKKK